MVTGDEHMEKSVFFDIELKRAREQNQLAKYRAQDARTRVQQIQELLVNEFGVTQLILFGSLLLGKFDLDSDIDLAVKGLTADNFFKVYAAAEEIALPFRLDIVDLDSEPAFWRYVSEVEVLYDSEAEER